MLPATAGRKAPINNTSLVSSSWQVAICLLCHAGQQVGGCWLWTRRPPTYAGLHMAVRLLARFSHCSPGACVPVWWLRSAMLSEVKLVGCTCCVVWALRCSYPAGWLAFKATVTRRSQACFQQMNKVGSAGRGRPWGIRLNASTVFELGQCCHSAASNWQGCLGVSPLGWGCLLQPCSNALPGRHCLAACDTVRQLRCSTRLRTFTYVA
jgi:hypothetical protein